MASKRVRARARARQRLWQRRFHLRRPAAAPAKQNNKTKERKNRGERRESRFACSASLHVITQFEVSGTLLVGVRAISAPRRAAVAPPSGRQAPSTGLPARSLRGTERTYVWYIGSAHNALARARAHTHTQQSWQRNEGVHSDALVGTVENSGTEFCVPLEKLGGASGLHAARRNEETQGGGAQKNAAAAAAACSRGCAL